jgi:hypothetical protein
LKGRWQIADLRSVAMSEAQSPVAARGSAERKKELRLSTKGLENVASLRIGDFMLRFGEHEVVCNRFEASFLSPRITATLLNDPTITEYEVDVDECGSFDANCVSGLLSLSRNGSFELNSSNFETTKFLSKVFGNRELSDHLVAFVEDNEALSDSNVVARLSLAEFLETSGSREIEYLASHFYEIDRDLLKSLRHENLHEVIRSGKLQIESEDSLLDFVLELGDDFIDLLGCVRTEYLSVSGIDRLLTSISLSELDDSLWLSLCCRLRLFVEPSSDVGSRHRSWTKRFPIDSTRRFDGIIARLTRECGGNVHTKEVVSITASSTCRRQCHQVVDYDWNDYWYSGNSANSWIQFDFKTRCISVTNYTIKSDGDGGCHLLQWSLEGSNDGTSWVTLDQRNTQDLNGNYVEKSYECESRQSSATFFRFIRLIQSGPNSGNHHFLGLTNLDFFGGVSDLRSS